jgi:hypothetical protein
LYKNKLTLQPVFLNFLKQGLQKEDLNFETGEKQVLIMPGHNMTPPCRAPKPTMPLK